MWGILRRMVMVTSRDAFDATEELREAYTERIYRWLADNPESTDLDISVGTGITINTVPAARAKLFDEGRIKAMDKKVNELTGMKASSWSVMHGNPSSPVHRKMCDMCKGDGCTLCDNEGYHEVPL